MNTLTIEGVISRKAEAATMAPGEKTFSLEDLENFLASNGSAPFTVLIKSPGGSVEEGFRIYDRLKGLDVTTVALTANSIASVIFLAGKVRKVTPTTEIIIHNAWVDAEVLAGEKLNFHTLKALTELFAETDIKILSVYASVAGADKTAKLFALMAEDTNLGADLALSLGFATELTEEAYKGFSLKNKVLTFSQNYFELIALQDGPVTTYADVIYVNDAGEVLLVQRKDGDEFEPGRWGFPGGKVMQGEKTEDGAAREFEEETGIEVEVERLDEVVNDDESLTIYFTAYGNEEPVSLPEHQAARWVALSDIEGLPLIKNQVDRYKKLINQILTAKEVKTEEKLTAFEKMLNGLKNLFKSSFKNMAAVTKGGVAIFIAGAEDGELVGKTVYLAEEGLPTEQLAREGEHVLEDGTTVVLDAKGVIREVKPAVDVESLTGIMKEKDLEILDLKNQLQALKDGDAQKAKALEALQTEFLTLKNQIAGDPDDKKNQIDDAQLSAEEFAKLTPGEKIRLRAMAKADVKAEA